MIASSGRIKKSVFNFLFVSFLFVCFSLGFILGATHYDYDSSGYNPIFPFSSVTGTQYNEPSVLFNNVTNQIELFTGLYDESTNKRYFQYMYSTNGVNFSSPTNLTGFDGGSGQGYGLGYVDKVGDLYYMFVGNYSKAESAVEIEVWSSSNKIAWTKNCSITTGGYKKNPAFYYNEDLGIWEALIEEGSGTFDTYYWNSSSLCSGWTKYNQQFGEHASAPDIQKVGDEYVVYYTNYPGSPWGCVSVAKGTSLNSLVQSAECVVNSSIGAWADYFVSDIDFVIVPFNNTDSFQYYYYGYVIGVNAGDSDISLNLVFDNAVNSFETVHDLALPPEPEFNYPIIEYYYGDTNSFYFGDGNLDSIAQTFTLGVTGDNEDSVLNQIKLSLKKSSLGFTSGNVQACLKLVDVDGKPVGDCLDLDTISVSELTTSFSNYTFSFSGDVVLIHDTQYALVLSLTNGNSTFYVSSQGGTSGYSGGTRFISTDDGSSWTDGSADVWFEIQGNIYDTSGFLPYESKTLGCSDSYTFDWEDEFNITGFVLDEFSYDYIWVSDTLGCDAWNDAGVYTLLTYPLDETSLTSLCGWGYNWASSPQHIITFYSGTSDSSFSVKAYGCESAGAGYNCVQKVIDFTVDCSTSGVISGTAGSIITNVGSLFPDESLLTTKQKVSYILVFSILLAIILFVLGWLIFKSIPTGWVYLMLFLEFLLFVFFISVGYISLFVLIVLLLILFTIIILRSRGG